MKHIHLFFALFLIGLFSCQGQNQRPDNTKPMYGEVPKSKEYQKIDDEFKLHCMRQFGSLGEAANAHIHFAWDYIARDESETAMKRFNQAWLLNPNLPDSYFGFAYLMDKKGDREESERFYQMGMVKDENGEALSRYNKLKDNAENGSSAVIEEFEISVLEE